MSEKKAEPNVYLGGKGENDGLIRSIDNALMTPEERWADGSRQRKGSQAMPKKAKKQKSDDINIRE